MVWLQRKNYLILITSWKTYAVFSHPCIHTRDYLANSFILQNKYCVSTLFKLYIGYSGYKYRGQISLYYLEPCRMGHRMGTSMLTKNFNAMYCCCNKGTCQLQRNFRQVADSYLSKSKMDCKRQEALS